MSTKGKLFGNLCKRRVGIDLSAEKHMLKCIMLTGK